MGRPKVPYRGLKPKEMRDSVWVRIVEAWKNDLSDREAAFYASEISDVHIKESDIKEMLHDYPEIEELKLNLQDGLITKAKMNVSDYVEAKDKSMTKWLLERKRAEEYSTKSAVAFEGAVVELTIEEKRKKLDDMLKDFGDE